MIYLEKPDIIGKLRPYRHSVLEASAGTGKTYALEHIVLDILIEEKVGTRRISLEDILVLTFTERATQDLKFRIRALIERCLQKEDREKTNQSGSYWSIDSATQLHLQAQLENFSSASIHTIHAFCRKILSENAFLLGRPLTEKIDNTNTIFNRAFKRALREDFACDPHLKPFLEAWLEKPGVELSKLQDHLEKLCRYEDPLRPDFDLDALRKTLDQVIEAPQTFDTFIAQQSWPLNKNAEGLRHCVNAYANHRCVATYLLEADAELGAMRGSAKNNNVASLESFENLATSPVRSLFLQTIPLETAILHLFSKVVRAYIKEEKRKGVFDFHDMLDSVHAALHGENSALLLRFLRAKFRFGLIDEFQDTDSKQWEIFKRIFVDSAQTTSRRANPLLLIGDPKQSIYAFRGADVQTYLSAQKTISQKSGPPIPLVTNFRSTETMIAAYNLILDQDCDPPFFRGAINYSHPVSCGNLDFKATQSGKDIVPIELIQPTSDSTIDAYALKRILARWMCSEISKLIEDPISVEGKVGKTTVGASDIFILTYSNDEARFIGGELEKKGITHSFYKQVGLFQSQEAEHLLRMLVAIDSPFESRHRLPAFATPFFGIPWQQLKTYENVDESHHFVRTLSGWHQLAEKGDYEALFHSIIEDSGVSRRELFDGANTRRITNYRHILEILLDEGRKHHLNLSELVLRLEGFISQRTLSKKDDRNIQRQDSNKNAVQIMTIHSSKGLEADVVFIYGGFSFFAPAKRVRFVHHQGKRLQYFGPARSRQAKKILDEQDRGEAERLLYVAMTRARLKLYLPYIIKENGKALYKNLRGRYKILNTRLHEIEKQSRLCEPLFSISQARDTEWLRPLPQRPLLSDLGPLEELSAPHIVDVSSFRPEPLILTSYSRMKGGNYEAAIFKGEVATLVTVNNDLPSGISTGLFLHELLEHIDLAALAQQPRLEWEENPQVNALFDHRMAKYNILDEHKGRAMDLIWGAIKTPFTLPCGQRMANLASAERERREVEFYIPIPEIGHPENGLPVSKVFKEDLEINTGFFKGFVDLIFEYNGKIYFADWKSDLLESYDKDTIERHVEKNYQTQAKLYSFALTRIFGIRDAQGYDARIGGFLYCFLRGYVPAQPGQIEEKHYGFHVGKIDYDSLKAYEADLKTRSYE